MTTLKERASAGRALSKDEEAKLLAAARESRSSKLSTLRFWYPFALGSQEPAQDARWSTVDSDRTSSDRSGLARRPVEGRQVCFPGQLCGRLWLKLQQLPRGAPGALSFSHRARRPRWRSGYLTGAGTSAAVDPTTQMCFWKTAFAGAIRRSGVQCRWHDLRHTWASSMAENGVPEQTMLSMAGWMSRKMLERYSHTRQAAKKLAVAGLDRVGVGTNVGTAADAEEEESDLSLLE